MQIPASFIEYLVSGCTALLWLLPLLGVTPHLNNTTAFHAALLIPVAYVLGMLIDGLARLILKPLSKAAFKQEADGNRGERSATAFAYYHSADLGKQIETRSSRDRIARGATVNCLILTLAVWLSWSSFSGWVTIAPTTAKIALIGATIACLLTWFRFERNSRRFRSVAVELIVEEKKAAPPKQDSQSDAE